MVAEDLEDIDLLEALSVVILQADHMVVLVAAGLAVADQVADGN